MTTGHIYILSNPAMPMYLKIGMTKRSPEDRAREISQSTGVVAPFAVAYSEEVINCTIAENMIHARLAKFRINDGREFFNLPLRDAIRELAKIADEVGRPEHANQTIETISISNNAPASADRDKTQTETHLSVTPSQPTASNQLHATSDRVFARQIVSHEMTRRGYEVTTVANADVDLTARRAGEQCAVFVKLRRFRQGSNESEMTVITESDLYRFNEVGNRLGMVPMIAYVVSLSTRNKTHLFLATVDHVRTHFKKVKYGYSLYFSDRNIQQHITDPKVTHVCWPDDNLERLSTLQPNRNPGTPN